MSTKLAGTIAGRIMVNPDPIDYGVDETTRSMPVNLRVWDSDLLQWVRMTQPVAEGGTIEELLKNIYWGDIRYEYSSGNCVYKGMNATMNADTSSTDWWIIRYDYDCEGNCTRKRVQQTSWDNRATGWT